VGRVSLYALEAITRRLAKIDRFSEAPAFEEPAAQAASRSGPDPDASASSEPTEAASAEPSQAGGKTVAEPRPTGGPLPMEPAAP